MGGHGRFSVIGGGNRPLPIELPKVEDLKPGGDTLGALNVDGVSKDGPAVADTRLDQANRVSAKLDTMLLKAAKTVVKPVDAKALKVAGRPPRPVPPYVGTKKGYVEYAKETQKSIRRTVCLFRRDLLGAIAKPGWFEE